MKKTIRLFGIFRTYVPSGEIEIEVPEQAQIKDLRILLSEEFHRKGMQIDDQLFGESAISSDQEILQDSDRVHLQRVIAVLPPVCGG